MWKTLFVLVTVLAAGCDDAMHLVAPTPVTPSVQGVWTGGWVRQECSETGGLVSVLCPHLLVDGSLRLTLTQSGASTRGSIELIGIPVSVAGQISRNGVVTLTGQGRQRDPTGDERFTPLTINIRSWQTTGSGTMMTGTFDFVIIPDDHPFDTATVKATLQNVTKIA